MRTPDGAAADHLRDPGHRRRRRPPRRLRAPQRARRARPRRRAVDARRRRPTGSTSTSRCAPSPTTTTLTDGARARWTRSRSRPGGTRRAPVWRGSVRRGIPVYFVQDIETSYYPDDHALRGRVLARLPPRVPLHDDLGLEPRAPARARPDADARSRPGSTSTLPPARASSARDDVLLALGRANPLKNLPLTLDACAALPEPRPELWLFGIEPELGDRARRALLRAPQRRRGQRAVQHGDRVRADLAPRGLLPAPRWRRWRPARRSSAPTPTATATSAVDGENCLMPAARRPRRCAARIARLLATRSCARGWPRTGWRRRGATTGAGGSTSSSASSSRSAAARFGRRALVGSPSVGAGRDRSERDGRGRDWSSPPRGRRAATTPACRCGPARRVRHGDRHMVDDRRVAVRGRGAPARACSCRTSSTASTATGEPADHLGAFGVLDLPVDFLVIASHMRDAAARLRPDAPVPLVRQRDRQGRLRRPGRAGRRRAAARAGRGTADAVVQGRARVRRRGPADDASRRPSPSSSTIPERATWVPTASSAGSRRRRWPRSTPSTTCCSSCSRFEGLGLPPLEAFHVGVPAWSTPFTGSDGLRRARRQRAGGRLRRRAGTAAALDRLARDPACARGCAGARWPPRRAGRSRETAAAAFAAALQEPRRGSAAADAALRRMAHGRRRLRSSECSATSRSGCAGVRGEVDWWQDAWRQAEPREGGGVRRLDPGAVRSRGGAAAAARVSRRGTPAASGQARVRLVGTAARLALHGGPVPPGERPLVALGGEAVSGRGEAAPGGGAPVRGGGEAVPAGAPDVVWQAAPADAVPGVRTIAPGGAGLWRRAPLPAADALFALPLAGGAGVLVAGGDARQRDAAMAALAAAGTEARAVVLPAPADLAAAAVVAAVGEPGAPLPALALPVLRGRRACCSRPAPSRPSASRPGSTTCPTPTPTSSPASCPRRGPPPGGVRARPRRSGACPRSRTGPPSCSPASPRTWPDRPRATPV